MHVVATCEVPMAEIVDNSEVAALAEGTTFSALESLITLGSQHEIRERLESMGLWPLWVTCRRHYGDRHKEFFLDAVMRLDNQADEE